MDFTLTEDQELIINMVREFADKEVRPVAAELDHTHRFPAETVARMRDLGILGLSLPETYGGAGSGCLTSSLAIEELSKVDAAHGTILSVHLTATHAIGDHGTDAQKQKYLPDLCSGRKLCALAMTEPGAGTDAAAQKTVAVKDGDRYVVNGSKVFITNGSEAGTYVVVAMTDPSRGLKGISAFIVERETPGLHVGQLEKKMGIRASATAELFFKDMIVPAGNLLGKEGDGFKIAMQTLDTGRIGIAAQALGIAEGALEAAIAYIKERRQFGKPIAAFQGIQWMVAEMAARIEAARYLVYKAAGVRDAGRRVSKDAALAKLVAATTAMDVTVKAVQLFGGIGYTEHFPVERFLRDAKITEIYEGTNEVMKMVISGAVLA